MSNWDGIFSVEQIDDLLQLAEQYDKVFCLIDENTKKYCLPEFEKYDFNIQHYLEIKSGEQHKNIDTCKILWNELMKHGATRNSLLINLGGGVIGDMGGFVAATYKRGVDFIQMPTTLLAMVDASIGGKTGIDFMGLKNQIGLIKKAKGVFVNPAFLKTLPLNELQSGFAEMMKHALIDSNEHWKELGEIENLRELTEEAIFKSIGIKMNIVAADEQDNEVRKILNLGHTVGHALESYFLQTANKLTHGAAVAAGILAEFYLAKELGFEVEDFIEKYAKLYLKHFEKVNLQEVYFKELIEIMQHDKKNIGNEICFSLITGKQERQIDITASHLQIRKALLRYSEL